MPEYVIYRHGWNEENQAPKRGLPKKMAVARMEAGSPEEACRLAEADVTLEPGQYLSAEPAEEVDAKENALNNTARTQHSPPAGEPDDLAR